MLAKFKNTVKNYEHAVVIEPEIPATREAEA